MDQKLAKTSSKLLLTERTTPPLVKKEDPYQNTYVVLE
jgi:hypothetical protein